MCVLRVRVFSLLISISWLKKRENFLRVCCLFTHPNVQRNANRRLPSALAKKMSTYLLIIHIYRGSHLFFYLFFFLSIYQVQRYTLSTACFFHIVKKMNGLLCEIMKLFEPRSHRCVHCAVIFCDVSFSIRLVWTTLLSGWEKNWQRYPLESWEQNRLMSVIYGFLIGKNEFDHIYHCSINESFDVFILSFHCPCVRTSQSIQIQLAK